MTATVQETLVPPQAPPEEVTTSGIVELGEGHGFVRVGGYRRGPGDVYISASTTRQHGLRTGDLVEGAARAADTKRNRAKNSQLVRVDVVNGRPAATVLARPRFDDWSVSGQRRSPSCAGRYAVR